MKTVHIVFRNADTTEGRGPMVLDRVFADKEKANAFIDSQPGVMGRRAKWSTILYGDWEVRTLEVIE